jgi:hypothetical protein
VKILEVKANNRKKVFEVVTTQGEFSFPYAKLSPGPSPADRIREVYADPEIGMEGFTCVLESGAEDTVHVDAVLEYNRDPAYMNDLFLYLLTVHALEALEETGLSKREIARRLGTSPSQFYRLVDPTYYGKSIGQMMALLWILGRDVELVVKPRAHRFPSLETVGHRAS